MKWEWKGQPLAPPLQILRRLIALPILNLGLCICFLALYIGWGLYDAKHFWKHNP